MHYVYLDLRLTLTFTKVALHICKTRNLGCSRLFIQFFRQLNELTSKVTCSLKDKVAFSIYSVDGQRWPAVRTLLNFVFYSGQRACVGYQIKSNQIY